MGHHRVGVGGGKRGELAARRGGVVVGVLSRAVPRVVIDDGAVRVDDLHPDIARDRGRLHRALDVLLLPAGLGVVDLGEAVGHHGGVALHVGAGVAQELRLPGHGEHRHEDDRRHGGHGGEEDRHAAAVGHVARPLVLQGLPRGAARVGRGRGVALLGRTTLADALAYDQLRGHHLGPAYFSSLSDFLGSGASKR